MVHGLTENYISKSNDIEWFVGCTVRGFILADSPQESASRFN